MRLEEKKVLVVGTGISGIAATELLVGQKIDTVLFDGNSRAKFIAIPDLDPITGESNFYYKYNGMSTKFFEEQALVMDDVSYKCL